MIKMYCWIVIFNLLQYATSHNNENSCGCNVNRDQKEYIQKGNVFKDMNDEYCPVELECSQFKQSEESMVLVPAGEYQVGTDDVAIESDKEGPKRIVKLNSFLIDKYEVSNNNFGIFVSATNYKTEAEVFGDSFVFAIFLNKTVKENLKDFRVVQTTWWYKVFGVNWKHPYEPDSDLSELQDHPVTHVSWNDARMYCKWRNARLPTEAEWEAACRGGHRDTKYPWGDKLFPGRKHMANIWQGTFPHYNSAKDGYIGTNPVNLFPQNDFQLHNMAGNVWEWTEDVWSEDNPKEKVKKGGSYLCHHTYCYRYRCSARSHNTDDSSAGNLGFRCVKTA